MFVCVNNAVVNLRGRLEPEKGQAGVPSYNRSIGGIVGDSNAPTELSEAGVAQNYSQGFV